MITVEACTDPHLLADLNEDVQDLHHRLYPEVFKPFDRAGMYAAFQVFLAAENVHGFLARIDREVAGYMMLRVLETEENPYKYAARVVYLDQIHVLDPFRKQGVGRVLVEHLQDFARQRGIDRIQLDHWTANEGARRFFGRLGFGYFQEKMELRLG